MVSPVDPSAAVARLAAAMRRLAADSSPAPARGRSKREAAGKAGSGSTAGTAGLRVRLQAITDEAGRPRRAAPRLLVETLLADEFGADLRADPAFQKLVDDVLSAMDACDPLREALDATVNELQRVQPV